MPDTEQFLHDDVKSHARILTELVKEQRLVKEYISDNRTDKAVRAERDVHLHARLDRIEERINGLVSVGKWILLSFGASFIAAIATFIIKGGLNVP